MKKSVLFLMGQLCLFLTIICSGRAQVNAQSPAQAATLSTGKISGMLSDSLTGKPLEFATVALLQQGSTQATTSTLTDTKGSFTLSEVGTGTYKLAISFIGYKTKVIEGISITAAKPEVILGAVKISPVARQLQEVNVQALRPTITLEADKMVVSVAGTAMAAGSTAFDVLAKSPGVFVDQEGNIQLNGRAGVTIMLDGKLTYLSGRDLRTMLEGMSAENIKNIEIITNPSARYDAEGASGILNINLKKNEQQGINGSIYSGLTYNWKDFGYTAGGNINYKSGKWNSFLNLDAARRVGGREATFTRVFYAPEQTTYFDQVATGNYQVEGPPSVRVGTDYSINQNHSVGFMAYYVTNYLEADFLTDTYMGSAANQPELYIDANNYTRNRFSNLTTNLHYMAKLDTSGSTLSADLDYVRITNRGDSDFFNFYDSLATDKPVRQDFLFTDTPNGYDIYAAKADYTRALSNGHKLETGAKVSRVVSDNDSRFYFNNSEGLVLDLSRSNHFQYEENIYAAYVNWSGKLNDRFSAQAGMRAECTTSRGESLTTGQVTNREYLDFFPSVFLQQKVNEDYQLRYSYSRRLYRPNYGNLNPFISYRDPYTYVQGNPFLRPQYTHAFSITQAYKQDYSLMLSYNLTKDVISEYPILDVESATTIYTTANVDNSQSLSLTAIAPVKLMKNWDTNNTLTLAYNAFETAVNAEQLVNDQLFYMLQSSHNILLPLKLKMEVNATYRGPSVGGLYQIAPMWWVHLGLKRSILNDKLDVSLAVNDLFKSYRLKFKTDIGENINEFDQYLRNRSIGLTLRYNFSKGAKIEEKRRNNSLEELNRTGG
ncbi:outer membrane beta-barrel family protein [uncultured Pontibacter sp.]|uniref:outer membrane beta-barrel family protein n=1 Tax=uncultured Pontibacter sp. TaxID=453356 RepID=UPI0026135111|nr:outer membrane beta-barrel family protein [uncultured Pontibacter sp.]